jgi:hypothetical protein
VLGEGIYWNRENEISIIPGFLTFIHANNRKVVEELINFEKLLGRMGPCFSFTPSFKHATFQPFNKPFI